MRVRAHAGLEIDGFTIGEKLHEGGFATIWEVTHPLYRTPLVMKVPQDPRWIRWSHHRGV